MGVMIVLETFYYFYVPKRSYIYVFNIMNQQKTKTANDLLPFFVYRITNA